eukprot:CAMPEP_0185311274 /NCGR_PEP_ID=MMETSP1363-20130426/25851_1 /TAXON_ID=38817 /ORGANISM="Gephyrocapsa oceanica, Strain RCC1303" /LENGTH=122 /DNA_ID=CAMNT_0027908883 /DNA_START=13 /DNA_END=379 /DNA_ORIENTATION=-
MAAAEATRRASGQAQPLGGRAARAGGRGASRIMLWAPCDGVACPSRAEESTWLVVTATASNSHKNDKSGRRTSFRFSSAASARRASLARLHGIPWHVLDAEGPLHARQIAEHGGVSVKIRKR